MVDCVLQSLKATKNERFVKKPNKTKKKILKRYFERRYYEYGAS